MSKKLLSLNLFGEECKEEVMALEKSEKDLYVGEVVRAVRWQVHCTERAGQIIDPTLKLEKMEVCGSLGDFLRGDRKRFRTPVDFPKGNYSDIDLVLTFNKSDEEVYDILAKAEARNCPCVYQPLIGAHILVWNLPSHAPCKAESRVTI